MSTTYQVHAKVLQMIFKQPPLAVACMKNSQGFIHIHPPHDTLMVILTEYYIPKEARSP